MFAQHASYRLVLQLPSQKHMEDMFRSNVNATTGNVRMDEWRNDLTGNKRINGGRQSALEELRRCRPKLSAEHMKALLLLDCLPAVV